MNDREKQQYFDSYNKQLHLLGRVILSILVVILVSVPFIFGLILGGMPTLDGFMNGLLHVAPIYVPVAIVEFLVYAPMLGVGGTYITFITGNITNLKIPCIMNARDIAQTKPGTMEDEVVSTISSAVSGLVSIAVIFLGVLLIVPLTPILQSEALQPAFNTVIPALFGALGFKYLKKSPKIAIVPLLVMSILCIMVPSLISQTSNLLIPAGALALLVGYILFKMEML